MHLPTLSAASQILAFAALLSLTTAHPAPLVAHETRDLLSLYSVTHRSDNPSNPLSKLHFSGRSIGDDGIQKRSIQELLQSPTRGTINMASSQNHHIPLGFTVTPETCMPLAAECQCLINDLSTLLLSGYEDGVKFKRSCKSPIPYRTISETVKMRMFGREYRATLDLKLIAAEAGVTEMSKAEFHALVGLLGKTAGSVWEAMGAEKKGLGILGVEGVIEGVAIDAKWVFYEVVGGEARRCASLHSPSVL
jgi:hypothetical protein